MMQTPDKQVYSVKQINRKVKNLLEKKYAVIWIEGEVSGLAAPASGHMYFSLKEENDVIRCAYFRNRRLKGNHRPEDGDRVLAQGRISYYEPKGDLQFVVTYMEQAGAGALRREFERLKKKLSAEGLFDARHKSPLPPLPETIAIVTSDGGAALHDILTTLKRRYAAAGVIIYPTPVQGEKAAESISRAIATAHERNESDVLIIARGGGSPEDLQAFNSEEVARALFACEIPTVSGVGHEIDYTICDLAADHRAATPTAAAEMVTPETTQLLRSVRSARNDMVIHIGRKLLNRRQYLDYLSAQLTDPRQKLRIYRNQHRYLFKQILFFVQRDLRERNIQCMIKREAVQNNSPIRKINEIRRAEYFLHKNMVKNISAAISARKRNAAHLAKSIELMNPRHTLDRGYAIVQNTDKKVISDPAQLNPGEALEISVSKGQINATVNESKDH